MIAQESLQPGVGALGGGVVALDQLESLQESCAVVRGDGRIERLEGAWRGSEEALRSLTLGSGTSLTLKGTRYHVASGPLVESTLGRFPGNVPLSAKSEIVRDSTVMAVRLLDADPIVELLLTEDGHSSSIRMVPAEHGGTRVVFTLRSVAPWKKDTA